MLRVHEADSSAAVGGHTPVRHRTFVMEVPSSSELEQHSISADSPNKRHNEKKIWPIDAGSNRPVEARDLALVPTLDSMSVGISRYADTALEAARRAFEFPQLIRDVILKQIKIEPLVRYEGKGIICAWPTRLCPVKCAYCFFDSTMQGIGEGSQWNSAGVDNLIRFLDSANMGELRLSGGGDPFVERKTLNAIVSAARVDEITLVTSGFWAKAGKKAGEIIDELYQSHKQNPHGAICSLRVSVDEFHLERLKPVGMEYALNIVRHYMENYPNDPKFRLTLHTMVGDPSIDRLCEQLKVKSRSFLPSRTEHGAHRSEGMEVITLENGMKIDVRHAKVFLSDPTIDMRSDAARSNIASCEQDIRELHDGHVGLVYNESSATGLNFGMYHDGRLLSWGGSPPDNEHDIHTDTYSDMLNRVYGDVISLSVLEKGDAYIRSIVAEVNPQAADRAYGIALRDFYSRILFEESRTRLYACVRVLQDYIEEGRITAKEVSAWPEVVQQLTSLPLEQLQQVYRKSGFNIIEQYLQYPDISLRELTHLDGLIAKGHYDVSREDLAVAVHKSSTVSPLDKVLFARYLSSEAEEIKLTA